MELKLETPRLILRRAQREDCRELMTAIGSVEIAATTLGIPHPYSLEDACKWIERVNDAEVQKTKVDLGVFLKETGELVGGVGLSGINEKHHRAELGFWCAVEHWNKGITTEAADRMVQYGFEELSLERIYAICFTTNPASARVLEHIGMVREGTARHEYVKDGRFIDMHHYAILRGDWKELKG